MEIKKFVHRSESSTTTANATINKAYDQLNSNATEYLARYTSIGQELEPELKDFFGKLVDLWIDRSPEASAGVSLNTSQMNIPSDSFHSFGDHFPEFINPIRLRGMIGAVDNFTSFSQKVSRIRMERSLDPELLALALGQHEALPSPAILSEMLAKAELGLLQRKPEFDNDLKWSGWYLHAIGSSEYALETYGVDRQRAAFQISGHIFDLFLQSQDLV